MKIIVGTSGYGYKEWRGKFYPPKIAAGEMLRFYSGRLRAVEINNTFYHMPRRSVLASWAQQVPDDFVFAIKAPQIITHLKRLRDVGEEAEYFFGTLPVLEKKLGPTLLQFPAGFRRDYSALKDFSSLIPAEIQCAFEFRDASWINPDILDLLRERKYALCISDTDEKPAAEIVGAAKWGYLRLRRSSYTDAELLQWIGKISSKKWKKVFVFFKHESEAVGPETALRFLELAAAGPQD